MILFPILITFIFFIYHTQFIGKYLPNIETQQRILNVFRGENSIGKKTLNGLEELTGRKELWNDRIETFSNMVIQYLFYLEWAIQKNMKIIQMMGF